MKVLHILDSLNRGGAETLELDVCRNAARCGLDLTFAATGGGDLEEDFRNSGVEFIRLQRRLPIDLTVIARLRQIIKKRRIAIVHAHQAVEGIHAYFAAFGMRTKVVLSFHGFVADEKNRRTLQFLIRRTTRNIVVSRELLGWLATQKLNITRNFTVLYNGVDERRLQPSGKDLRAELKIPADAYLLGMIGNFYVAPRKDQMTLVTALPRVFAEIPHAHCLFVGSIEAGAETKFAECVKFCKQNDILDRVHFLGVRGDVPDILNALDVFVLSTLHEGLPIAVLEAMLAGAPCVLSDIAPNLEVARNGEFAQMFATQNVENLSEKLVQLAQAENLRNDLAARAQAYARQEFSISAHITKLKQLYGELI